MATYTETVASTLTTSLTLVTTFASTIVAGQPIQGNMRQLAFDRWNYMYPS